MDLTKKSLKLFLVVFLIIFVLFTVMAVSLRLYNESRYPDKFGEVVSESDKASYVLPRLLNSPPESVFLGEEYVFVPRIIIDDSDVEFVLIESPEWLSLERDIIRGYPDSLGTYSFVLRVIEGENYYDEVYYFVVKDDENE